MRKEGTWKAETVEQAIDNAAAELGLSKEALTVEVLQEPQKKAFGFFGKSEAVVQITYDEPDTPETNEVPSALDNEDVEVAKAYLSGVLEAMGVEGTTITVKEKKDGCLMYLAGENEGLIIGRRGETLDALQYLTSLVANRQKKEYYRITLNVGDYREKREKSLTGLAKKHAIQVSRTGRKHSFEPMNPYERRIIHTAVQDVKGVTSWSEGKEPNRYVIIGTNGEYRPRNRKPQPEKRDVYDSTDVYMRYAGSIGSDRPVREFVSRSNPLPVADGATPTEKTVSEAEEKSDYKLYGRIDL